MKAYLAALAVSASLGAPALAAPPPASAFGRIPSIVTATLSPDGKRVAILGGASDQRFVSIATVDQPDLPVVPLGNVEGVGLRWLGNDYLAARIAVTDKLSPRQTYRLERNIAISAKGQVMEVLLGKDSLSRYILEQSVLGVTTTPPVRALVEGLQLSGGPSGDINTKIPRKGTENPFVAALFSVDPVTGLGTLVERGNYDTRYWEVDSNGQARVRLEVDQITRKFSVVGRAKGQRAWSQVWSGGDYDSRRFYYGYSEPDDGVYLAQDGRMVLKPLGGGPMRPFGAPLGATNPQLVWDDNRNTAVGIQTCAAAWKKDPLSGVIGA